ncbi:dual specificity protein kinase domain-containing protein [Phanerochaete sordida]|uniref:dual-specificity kinase n=1 Tax=Phanerochaete sordida TaxID=48140 RepID=A0A9P3LJ03_9APHY|nr:dual specificity protein kinase domain-containing protein [Phanerochaete sordida]
MSSASSPTSSAPPVSTERNARRVRPAALEFQSSQSSDEARLEHADDASQPTLHVSGVEGQDEETEPGLPRSASATSSLDPYYFSIGTPCDSPDPSSSPMSMPPPLTLKTPELGSFNDPMTPRKDPAAIDRRGLVGVGELATPRWVRGHDRRDEVDVDRQLDEEEEEEINDDADEDKEVDLPDSPWTIEAIDGEADDLDEFLDVQPLSHSLRSKRSIADESGGEEILYPRHPIPALAKAAQTPDFDFSPIVQQTSSGEAAPPSAFVSPDQQRPKKRTSDEFEMDYNTGLVSSKHTSTSSVSSLKDKEKVRRHRSLGPGVPSTTSPVAKPKDARRETLSVGTRHQRQVSASSSSSSHGESHHSRRLHTSDYSHLPPSPGSSSIQQFLRHASSGSTATATPAKDQAGHSSANVAHSLLRGTQEGWSDMDDQATVEALRKLDGVSGKSARARSSIGAHSRVGSSSRSSTPAKIGGQWEGVENRRSSRIGSSHGSISGKEKLKEHTTPQRGVGLGIADTSMETEANGVDEHGSPAPEKAKKHTSLSHRTSFTPKRGSASSTTYTSTPTTSSRDSTSLSVGTSATSVSAASGRQSNTKARRNSAGSDISSGHSVDATSFRDRAAALAAPADIVEEHIVPPVPPLPKDLSALKSLQSSNTGVAFPSSDEDKPRHIPELEPAAVLEVPSFSTPHKHQSLKSTTPTSAGTNKTPSKKWSFSNPLGKKLVTSPSQSSMKESKSAAGLALSPRALSFTQQLRKSTSREHPKSPNQRKQSQDEWMNINVDAMGSASSLVSLSSVGSVHPMSPPASAPPPMSSKTPERLVPSRPETASSSSTNLTASAPPVPQQMPLSPSSSIRRGPSTKRLTPSSIPFFRRSSSQSMQMPPPGVPSASPTYSSSSHLRPPSATSPVKDTQLASPAQQTSVQQKKSSVFGLPSLLKGSSSRRSLHSDKEKSDSRSGKDEGRTTDKEKQKKEEKDRSESRISVLMGRKRGKTLSSAQPKKAEPVAMPPMHVSALPPATTQRLANMKTGSNSSLSSTQSTPKISRITSQTVSSMQKQSDASLRSTRGVLPTIAGSPSVGTLPHQSSKEPPPPSSLNTSYNGLMKETPTKIPRISSRSSATNSPTLKGNGANRRASVIIGGSAAPSRGSSPLVNESSEFGVLENGITPKATVSAVAQRQSVRSSPQATASTSRVPRSQVASSSSATVLGLGTRQKRESISFSGLRKSSTGSVASITTATTQAEAPAPQPQAQSHRFSALSPSKGLKLLSPKISLSTARNSTVSASQSTTHAMSSPSTSRHGAASTPSPVSSLIDEDELLGDEEMMQYIKKQQAKKLASGASQAVLDEMLRFPEPIPPASPLSPAAVLKSRDVQWLSEYECKEILDYPSVYYIGAKSDKKPATLDNTTNNHGYDDERGDYLVVIHDHLAYRYEVIDTLGKGSFGQVLHCRDRCTGESVAIKIIRNKKRFHHQALVEIKILDSLRKWDSDEKHHVIKMTEHFYFRGHLCIAMELLSINLYELIKANSFVGFSTGLIRRFTSQMLQSLVLMRHHRIVHCDLKPENVLLRHPAKSAIKVIDFGSSCFEHEKIYTYIQSRFYRSPEVILGMNYHMAIDMWSLGCIMAELYTGFPIFPGENEQEQLSCIMEVLGVPEKDFINRSSRKRLFFDQTGAPRPVVNSKGRRRRPGSKTLQQVLRCDDELFVDFISKCLVWDPERRLKPHAALRHPFITGGKRTKVTSPQPPPPQSTSKQLLSSASGGFSSRSSKTLTETPKKSLISAPTPLTARTSRVTTGNTVPTTPSNSGSLHTNIGSSRSYRSSQSQSLSYHSSHSSRTMLAK